MTETYQAIIWASIILIAAIVMIAGGVNDGASSGVILGLSGAACASLQAEFGCGGKRLS